ncbi:HlyD family type I secretion periplasmic adaptor subunit [Rhizobium sp. SAFR-030]|uniref:HlyD family type I secretion periplasmic adaptor subunit n=1 Tax=Rhizobium sp. SAFR-030 TaxID=3387277 RepID=UPI003F80D3C0
MARKPASSRQDYSNPWRPARYGLAAIAAFVVLLGAWGATAPLSGAVIASGSLQVEGRRQKVQHPYGGVVETIDVREGQMVQRGDVLMTLSDAEPRAKYSILQHSRVTLLAERARLIAERDGVQQPDFREVLEGSVAEGDARQLIDNQAALMQARQKQYAANVDSVSSQIRQTEEQARGFEAEIDGLRRQVELAENEAQSGRNLLQSGAVSRSRVLALEGRVDTAQAELSARRSELAAAQAKIGEARLKITQIERERTAEVTTRLQEVDASLAELQPNLDTAKDMLERTQVRAPATGNVVGLTVFTVGGVIQAGSSLMEIVPQDDPLFVDAKLKLSDISDVRKGQAADVRLIGVPRNMRPKIGGEITTVSADSLAENGSGERYYAVQVSLNRADVDGARLSLQPGMPVQVIVETRPRTLVSYLTSPLMDEISGAFRER